MNWLDRPLGPLRVRAWGLLLNFVMNGIGLTGLALWLGGRAGSLLMWVGLAGTIACILILAVPDRRNVP
ncbi:MAG: hypothetical protein ACYC2K_14310 [Gemmatimonadales bacterium]